MESESDSCEDASFEDLCHGHVEAYPGWLLLLVSFLTERPRDTLEALRRLKLPKGGGMSVACVSRSWRAAEEAVAWREPWREDSGLLAGPGPWPPLQPALSLAPDGRAGFATGTGSRLWSKPGRPSVWDWLEALGWLYFVGKPLVYRKVVMDDGDRRWQTGDIIREGLFPRYHSHRLHVQSLEAIRFGQWLRWFQERMPWGLEVRAAEEIAQNWLRGGLQVTVWLNGVHRVSAMGAPVEIMLDLTCYRWVVVRGGHGRLVYYTVGPAPRHWGSAYGN